MSTTYKVRPYVVTYRYPGETVERQYKVNAISPEQAMQLTIRYTGVEILKVEAET